MKGARPLVLLLAAAAAARAEEPAPAAPAPLLLDAFDEAEWKPCWKVTGGKFVRMKDPMGTGGSMQVEPAAGNPEECVVTCELPVKDLRGFDAVAFRLRGRPVPDLSVVLRKGASMRALEERVPAPPEAQWLEVVLPLRHMANGAGGLLADAADMDRLEFHWWKPGTYMAIDDVRLIPGTRGNESWRLPEEEACDLALGPGKGRVHRGKRWAVLADPSEWNEADSARFLQALEPGMGLIENRFSMKGGCDGPVRILRLRNDAEQSRVQVLFDDLFRGALSSRQAREERVGDWGIRRLGPPPRDPKVKLFVDTRDYCPAYVDRYLRQKGGWIGAAIAWDGIRLQEPKRYKDLADGFLRVVGPEAFVAFLQGKPTRIQRWSLLLEPSHRAWPDEDQRISVVEFLLATRKKELPAIWAAVQAMEGAPGFGEMEAIAKALGTTVEALETEWAKWGAAHWGVK